MNIEEFIEIKSDQSHFQPYKAFIKTHKIDYHNTYLARLRLHNPTPHPITFFVDFDNLEYGRAYYALSPTKNQDFLFGRFYPLSLTAQEEYMKGAVSLQVPPHFQDWIFFELKSVHHLKTSLYTESYHHKKIKQRNGIQALFHGGILVLFFYNIILFIGTKDRTYLYYSMYIITAAAYYFYIHGFAVELLFAQNPRHSVYVWLLSISTTIFFVLFMRHFTDTPKLMPNWDKVLRFHPYFKSTVILMVITLFYFEVYQHLISYISILTTLLEFIPVTITLVLLALSKDKVAYFFVASTGIMLLCVFISQIGFFWFPTSANYFGQFGIIIELILFSVGLSYRINQIRAEKEQVQNEFIKQLKENKRLQEITNIELENRVKNRTVELREANNYLNNANEELKQAVELVNNQNDIIRRKNTDITSAINYAKRIQSAILPEMAKIQSIFPNSFILFKPRDIVSGDFYFLSVKPTKVIIVCADCTGHGVPGAFMSLIGNAFFSQIIDIQNFDSSETILEQMRLAIRTTLKQDQTGGRDGMEVGICILHRNQKDNFSKLEFSGAGHSLYFFDENATQLQSLPSNRIFIGGVSNYEKQFVKHQVTLPDEFTFYLFSDGYADQFGGQHGKKFMKKRFQQLLTNIQFATMAEQKNILEQEHQQWRGQKYKQLDDILVIGIRFNKP